MTLPTAGTGRRPRTAGAWPGWAPVGAPAKWAMSRLGLCRPDVRLPILPLTEAGQVLVDRALREAGLL